jgi:hypothetical protein
MADVYNYEISPHAYIVPEQDGMRVFMPGEAPQ